MTKIKWLGVSGYTPSMGLVETEKIYEIPQNLAVQFVSEGIAVVVETKPSKQKEEK